MKKIIIDEIYPNYDFDEITLSKMIEVCTKLSSIYGKDAKLSNQGYENVSYTIKYNREETDEEYSNRVEEENKKEKLRQEKELKAYSKLKEKLEKEGLIK